MSETKEVDVFQDHQTLILSELDELAHAQSSQPDYVRHLAAAAVTVIRELQESCDSAFALGRAAGESLNTKG